MPSRLGTHALALAKRGWHVFPLKPNTKVPFDGTRGLLDATTDSELIRSWWDSEPNANVGVSCGPSGIAVLDVDPKSGGSDSLMVLLEEHGPEVLNTLTQATPSGGRHYIFKAQGGERNSASVIAPGLDVRGDGGYIVIAPSVIDGKPYHWVNPEERIPPAPFPTQVLPKTNTRAALEVDEDTAIIAGARNDTLARLAGRLRRQGFGATEIYALLSESNKKRCRPPLPDDEVRAIARSIARYDPAERITPAAATEGVMSMADLYERADEDIEWLIEGMLPKAGVMLMSSRPKVGKSQTARSLAYAVATGGSFLGRRCQQGPVLWLAMEEQAAVVADIMRALNVGPSTPWYWKFGAAPHDAMLWLEEMCAKVKPALVVIDTWLRLTNVAEINSYSEVTRATQPLLALSRESGVAQLWLHHNNKGTDTTRGVLGSSALVGSVDTTMIITRNKDNVRLAYTEQRVGFDMEETALHMDPDTYWVSAGESGFIAEQRAVEKLILAALKGGPMDRKTLLGTVSRRASIARGALQALVSAGEVAVSGRGTKGENRVYALPERAELDVGLLQYAQDML